MFVSSKKLDGTGGPGRIYRSLALKRNNPLSAGQQPVKGKRNGDKTDFNNPFLFNTMVRSQK